MLTLRCLLLVACAAALSPRAALAAGNVTHAWISMDARTHLPEGELRDLLGRPGVERFLRNGTMFPDGGYPIGDDYGEMAHWEPFQDRYLEWIRTTYAPPWSDEAAAHIAFLFGMASHGMADQIFDAVFVEASRAVDPGWSDGCDGLTCGFDSVTDFYWASVEGPQPDPERWIPDELFPALFRAAGHEVSAETMQRGTNQVGLALLLVSAGGADPALIAQHEPRFPHAFAHMTDTTGGAPPNIARFVALYWQLLWRRLHGKSWIDTPVLGTLPVDGAFDHPREASNIGARVSVVFARGLSQAALDPTKFRILDADGRVLPTTPNLYYREASHVVNLLPTEDFAERSTYRLEVDAGIVFFDGSVSRQPSSASFHTSPPPVVTPAGPPSEEPSGCGTAASGLAGLVALAVRRRRSP